MGTPDYIAPEVLLKKGYGMECDWLVESKQFMNILVNQLKSPPHPIPTKTRNKNKWSKGIVAYYTRFPSLGFDIIFMLLHSVQVVS